MAQRLLPRTTIRAGLYAGVALLCTQIPLFNSFGYEFSFLVGLLAVFVTGPSTVRLMRPLYRGPAPERPQMMRALLMAIATHLTFLIAPLAVMLLYAATVRSCSIAEGLGFFFLLPVVTTIFCTTLACFCTVHYRRPILIYFFLFFATVVYALALGYFTPAIFSYNFFYGYFPGLTYDESLPLTMALVLFRLLTLLLSAFLAWMTMLVISSSVPEMSAAAKGRALIAAMLDRRRLPVTILACLLGAAAFFFRCDLGFESTQGFIQKSLGGEYRTGHFVIYYAPGTTTDVEKIGAEHEFRLAQLMEAFSIVPDGVIASYIYPSSETKQRLIGAGNTNIAKPWNREVHLTAGTLHSTLKHELAHVMAARFGLPVINASLSTGLVEGLAMAVEGNRGERTQHDYAAAMTKRGIAPDISGLMSLKGFAAHSSSVSYVLAGSFCRYLIDRYGMRKFTRLYRTGSYETIYGRTLEGLVREWRSYLDRLEISDRDTAAIDAFFRRPAIFGKICPRYVARRNHEAREAMIKKEYPTAAEIYGTMYRATGSFESLSGYLTASFRMGQYDTVCAFAREKISRDDFPARYLPLSLLTGDAFWGKGDTAAAVQIYRSAADADLSAWLTEQALLRLAALHEDHPAEFFPCFTADMDDTSRLVMVTELAIRRPTSPVAQFLRARASERIGRDDDAYHLFARIPLAGLPPWLQAQRLMAMGGVLFRLGRYQEAKIPFWESLNFVHTRAREEIVDDEVAHCDWETAHVR
jgi:hypothetical protein